MNRQRGSAMVLTMAVLAGIVAIVASFSSTLSAEFRARINRVERERAELMAESGLQRAIAELVQPNLNPGATSPEDPWAQLGQRADQNFLLDGGSCRIEIVDAGSLVNLNTATEEQLLRLPLTTEQIDSLLDWRSNDQAQRPEGARDEYYNQLTYPYNAALTSLETLDELLLIKGFTGATLYRQPTDQVNTQYLAATQQQDQPVLAQLVTVYSATIDLSAAGGTKADIANVTQQQLVGLGFPPQQAIQIFSRRTTFQRLGDVFTVPGLDANSASLILDNFTFGTNQAPLGRINLNTASEAVLNTIPGFTPDVAQAVLSMQQQGMTSLGQLVSVPGVSMQVLQQCADLVTVNSTAFLIRVIGTSGRISVPLEALVAVQNGAVTVLQRNRPPVSDPRTLWRWAETTTNDIDLRSNL